MARSKDGSIRSACQGDLESILEILNLEILTSASNFHWEPRALAELEQEWVAAQGSYPWLVFEHDGVLGGFAKASAFRSKQAYGWTAEVTIYLAPLARRQGLGQVLYKALLEELKLRGFHLAIGAITRPNAASDSLHSSLGFRQIGVLPEVGWKMGAWHDVSYWAKQLNDGPADDRLLPEPRA